MSNAFWVGYGVVAMVVTGVVLRRFSDYAPGAEAPGFVLGVLIGTVWPMIFPVGFGYWLAGKLK